VIVECVPAGPLKANCYVLGCERSRAGVVIDPGGDAAEILRAARLHGLTVKLVVNTHGHFDHVGGNRALVEATGARLLAHAGDAFLLAGAAAAAAELGFRSEDSPPPDQPLEDGMIVGCGGYRLRCLHTPGHSPGGCCLHCESEGLVFTGDTLLNGAIGRWDLPGAFHEELIRSIRERLFTLPEATRVHPGHGPATTIGIERQHNLHVPRA